jgi:hypothetical protein
MVEGRVYRREELLVHSKAFDRNIAQLVNDKKVVKAGPGLYYRPKVSRFGPLAANPEEVVRAFLKTDDFLLTSLNYFNGLGVGLTQLTNESLVYNRKRFGRMTLDGMRYNFQRPINYPTKDQISEEYLFIDLLNNYSHVHEPPETSSFIKSLRRKANELRRDLLLSVAARYGKASARKILKQLTTGE